MGNKSRRVSSDGRGRERHLSIRSVRRDPPDLRKLASALIALAQAQAEKDAEADHHSKKPSELKDGQS